MNPKMSTTAESIIVDAEDAAGGSDGRIPQ